MCEAFWTLLEDHQLHDITVSVLVAKANCNRGTFYYHFDDMDSLTSYLIEKTLIGDGALVPDILRFFIDQQLDETFLADATLIHRMTLLMERGGHELVVDKIRQPILKMWTAVLCPDGAPLSTEAQMLIEYNIGGIMGVLSNKKLNLQNGTVSPTVVQFVQNNIPYVIECLGQTHNMPAEIVISRLDSFQRFSAAGYRR